ncbi:MAG: TonB-dependent receptor [Bacteroidales bacterium]|nr:TonB-dependent receptor [Bacteroidales bacterium]
MRKGILTFISLFICVLAFGQEQTISGTITDAENGSPLPGVNIVVEGTTMGTTSDMNGEYEIIVPEDQDVLVFSFVGYERKTVQINGRSTINVSLQPRAEELEEVIVVGYGTQQKSLVTGSISKVESEDLTGLPISRAEEALEGKTAGVSVVPTSGSPGAGMKVRIRGTGSNQNSQPLYIVDGMKTGDISFLSPSDIESIEILKDAASAAIYGAEGANGVVLISTKSGSKDETKISYDVQYGMQSAGNTAQPMTADMYTTYMNEAGHDIVQDAPNNVSTNWVDQTFQQAPMQKHNLSFSGGSENSTYMFSGSYFNQKGIVGGDKADFNRYSIRFNSTHEVKDWIEVGNNLTYTNFNRSAISEDNVFGSVIGNTLMFDPLVPVTYDGTPGIIQDALDNDLDPVTNNEGEYYGVSRNTLGEIVNPLAAIQNNKGNTEQNKLFGNVFARLKPVEGLNITSRFGVDYASQLYHTWSPKYWYSVENQSNSTDVRDNYDRWYTWLWENFAEYSFSINNHNVRVLGGVSAQQFTHKYLTTLSGPLFKEGETFAQHGSAELEGRLSGNKQVSKQASYYARINYDYQNKYLFEAAFRRDGSSLLGPEYKWGNFPSVSAGWVVSEEDFWGVDAINFFKLRGSWGENGSLSNLGYDQYRALITTSGLRYPTATTGYYAAAEPQALANPELRWETSIQSNFGLDVYFWNSRVTFSADYYQKVTKDLLTPSSPPLSVGNYAPYVNAGDVTNKGFEFQLGLSKREGDFNYNMNFNLSTNDNEVTYLNPLLDRVSGANVGTGWTVTYFEEGKPVWYFRGYETAGIFQNEAQIQDYINEHGLTGYNPQPGDPIIVNNQDDGLINAEDQKMIGNPHPDILFGANLNFSYKNFDMRMYMAGQAGNDILMAWNRTDRATYNRPQYFYDNRWTGEGSTNDFFRAQTQSPLAYHSDMLVFDGSYLRVKQIELGYTLPENMLRSVNISKARLFVSLNDYFTFTKYPGMDPVAGSFNVQSLGVDRGVYPIAKKVMAGLSVTF